MLTPVYNSDLCSFFFSEIICTSSFLFVCLFFARGSSSILELKKKKTDHDFILNEATKEYKKKSNSGL